MTYAEKINYVKEHRGDKVIDLANALNIEPNSIYHIRHLIMKQQNKIDAVDDNYKFCLITGFLNESLWQ